MSVLLASRYRRSKNVVIETVVILELTFRDVERHIFATDLVVAADNRPLEDRPEAFNRVRVNCTNEVTLTAARPGYMYATQAMEGAMSILDQGRLESLILDGKARTFRQVCNIVIPASWELTAKIKAEMQVDRTLQKLKRNKKLVARPKYKPYRITWVAEAPAAPTADATAELPSGR